VVLTVKQFPQGWRWTRLRPAAEPVLRLGRGQRHTRLRQEPGPARRYSQDGQGPARVPRRRRVGCVSYLGRRGPRADPTLRHCLETNRLPVTPFR